MLYRDCESASRYEAVSATYLRCCLSRERVLELYGREQHSEAAE